MDSGQPLRGFRKDVTGRLLRGGAGLDLVRDRAAVRHKADNPHGFRPRSLILVGLADVMLRIELEAELGHEIELRLQEIDVVFLVGHQLFEQIA